MKIGVILREKEAVDNKKIIGLDKDVYNIVKASGNELLGIDSLDDLKLVSGVILPGGNNYQQNEIEIIKRLYEKNIPTLGICMGMQLMGVAFNGELEFVRNHKSNKNYAHNVYLKESSKLYSILKEKNFLVNTRHVEKIAKTSLDIVALSEDGVIEAVEDKTKSFFIGVQWHPESLKNDNHSKILFEKFFESCQLYKFNV